MDLSKFFYVFSPFAKQNQADVWLRFQSLLKLLLWNKVAESSRSTQCLGSVVPLEMFLHFSSINGTISMLPVYIEEYFFSFKSQCSSSSNPTTENSLPPASFAKSPKAIRRDPIVFTSSAKPPAFVFQVDRGPSKLSQISHILTFSGVSTATLRPKCDHHIDAVKVDCLLLSNPFLVNNLSRSGQLFLFVHQRFQV